MGNHPNIVFILTDQMRGDCLGSLGHPVVATTHLDALAAKGVIFTTAYSACPSCIAARVSVFTGLRPATHGRLGYQDGVPWNYRDTLAEILNRSGYQTHCVGKTHFFPQKLPLGFESQDSYEGEQNLDGTYVNDYFVWLRERTPIKERDAGLMSNSWCGGVSILPEEYHNNTWVATKGIEFLQRRDQSRPFFLNLSFHRPHAPLDPPREFFEQYKNREIPPVPVGAWAARYDRPVTDVNAWCGRLNPEQLQLGRRAYYAQIAHIDYQIGRFLEVLNKTMDTPTWFVFTSDHGEMLGDHFLFRKTYAYEGSAKIPLIVTPPDGSAYHRCGRPVSHFDLMPTFLEIAGVPAPAAVEGRSLVPLLKLPQEKVAWREYVHGEHSPCYHQDLGMQFVTDGREKYIWYTATGEEQLFDLVTDPVECHDLSRHPDWRKKLDTWRQRLIWELTPRTADGLTDGKKLIAGRRLPAVRPRIRDGTVDCGCYEHVNPGAVFVVH